MPSCWRLPLIDSLTVLMITTIHVADVIFDLVVCSTLYETGTSDMLALAIFFVVFPAILGAIASYASDPSKAEGRQDGGGGSKNAATVFLLALFQVQMFVETYWSITAGSITERLLYIKVRSRARVCVVCV